MTATVASASELPKTYDPGQAEGRLYARWVELGCFTADPASDKPAYTIVIPPPNVTGTLHMGHAFQHTLMDALTRRKRMQGFETLWLPGTDHAGIATQTVVERELLTAGTSRQDLGREQFLDRVWQWKEEYGGKILDQMRRLGTGVDWTRLRFTMDAGLSRSVRTIFKQLYDDGLIYRAERIVNWCPPLRTAVSDIEVESREVDGELVTIDYGPLQVATTRVETMLGDTAVAVHPQDRRYAHLIGTTIELPLVGRSIVVVGDDHVDPEFGTGAVKVTPAHDPNDFAIGQRHGLPMITIMDEEGRISGTGTRFDGLDRFAAREAVREALREQGRIVAEVRPYRHAVPHYAKDGTVIEPRLSLQWWVKVDGLARAAGDAVRGGQTTFVPAELSSRYFAWVDDMHDWCISRQLWWGHRIPVWYGPDGAIVCPAEGEEPTAAGWSQDPDVLDTWFSSALWPMSTLGWPEATSDLARFYPTDVLVTGYDIIFFWVARMMMFCSYATGQVPFRTVALTGLVRDEFGKKMSKSWGNVVDPLEWISAYGADALRFTLARGANPGVDVPVAEAWCEASRNFVNKIWNALRFGLANGADPHAPIPADVGLAERWVLSRVAAVTAEVDRHYDGYEFAKASDALFHLAKDEIFDWYVELAKVSLRRGGTEADATRAVLGRVLDTLLRLLHPLIPFVTDELWVALTGRDTVVTASWPVADPDHRDADAEAGIARLQDLVTEVRRFRGEQGLPPRRKVPAVLVCDAPGALAALAEHLGALADLTVTVAEEPPAGWPVLVAAGARVALDLSTGVDAAAEAARLGKALAVVEVEISRTSSKLTNPAFTGKAPAAVIDKTRARLAEAQAEAAVLRSRLDALTP